MFHRIGALALCSASSRWPLHRRLPASVTATTDAGPLGPTARVPEDCVNGQHVLRAGRGRADLPGRRGAAPTSSTCPEGTRVRRGRGLRGLSPRLPRVPAAPRCGSLQRRRQRRGRWSRLCAADEVCDGGGRARPVRQDACADAVANLSNIGCEYWAVDLDNESTNAPGATVEPVQRAVRGRDREPLRTPPRLGCACSPTTPRSARSRSSGRSRTMQVPPDTTVEIPLDSREVDGPMGEMIRDNRGSYRSPNAYRIREQLPGRRLPVQPDRPERTRTTPRSCSRRAGSTTEYRILGYPTSKPIDLARRRRRSAGPLLRDDRRHRAERTTVRVTPTHDDRGRQLRPGRRPRPPPARPSSSTIAAIRGAEPRDRRLARRPHRHGGPVERSRSPCSAAARPRSRPSETTRRLRPAASR